MKKLRKIEAILELVRAYIVTYKNWISVIFYKKVFRKQTVNVILRDDTIFNLSCNKLSLASLYFYKIYQYNKGRRKPFLPDFYYNFMPNNIFKSFINDIFCFELKDRIYKFNGFKNNGDVNIFFNDEYKFLDVCNEIVLDIGANIGDTPIYFALKGAKKIIALEPYPYPYSIAIENIKINKLSDIIILLNAGYGEDNIVKVDENYMICPGADLVTKINGKDIKIYSLETLLDKFDIAECVLKIDCEGCEYYLIKEKKETLQKFKRIQIEYHYGYLELKNKLEECGFNVKFTKPKKTYNTNASNPNMEVGYIFAESLD